jgi:hypothetical protein
LSFENTEKWKFASQQWAQQISYKLESFGSIPLFSDRIYLSDIMPSKHNSLPSIIYLVIRLQCFDPLLGHHQAYIKNKVYYILYFTCQTGSRVVYRVVYSLYRERLKNGELNVVTHNIYCALSAGSF